MADYLSREEAINAIKSLESSMPAKDNYAKGYDAALGRALIAVREVPPAADQQLAEWLTELKKLREENINLKNDNERLRDCVDSCVFNSELGYAELAEAKRLLKAAINDFAKLDREIQETKIV